MHEYKLYVELLSDTCFGRGDGIGGVVNSEVEHDAHTGLPFIKGSTIKGLLVEACADLLYGLQLSGAPDFSDTAQKLFGRPGSTHEEQGLLHIGNATLPQAFQQQVQASSYSPSQILNAMTAIRYQTAVDPSTDKPLDTSLRATRVVLRETTFVAPLISRQELSDDAYVFLCACVATVRRGGLNRSRGLGRLKLYIDSSETMQQQLAAFSRDIGD